MCKKVGALDMNSSAVASQFCDIAERIEEEMQDVFPGYSSSIKVSETGEITVHDFVNGKNIFGGGEEVQELEYCMGSSVLGPKDFGYIGSEEEVGEEEQEEEVKSPLEASLLQQTFHTESIDTEIQHVESLLRERIAYLQQH
jgi:hypothetical protein